VYEKFRSNKLLKVGHYAIFNNTILWRQAGRNAGRSGNQVFLACRKIEFLHFLQYKKNTVLTLIDINKSFPEIIDNIPEQLHIL
jgi:hypothetical protein